MINSYWELYVAYIDKCVRDNWINDIDPHHYRMEWNHWLPKACFPDVKVGQWLTFRQHSIASALQTLALKKNCMCGWHKEFLPEKLLELSWSFYVESCKEAGKMVGGTAAKRLNESKNPEGKSFYAVKGGEVGGRKAHEKKNNFGKSTHGVTNANIMNSQIWESTVDGFRSNAGAVSRHNRANGWDPNARLRVS
jgi:hypothetical protein